MIDWFMDLHLVWQVIIGFTLMGIVFSIAEMVFKVLSVAISIAIFVAVVYFGFLFFTGELSFSPDMGFITLFTGR